MQPDETIAYHDLSAYTLELRDPAFIHQHVVDAFMAQHASEETKPIGLTFALIGLYLHVEHGTTGRDVQKIHVLLGRRRRAWPRFRLPASRGSITAVDVMAAPRGEERDRAIDAWCASVWGAFRDARETIVSLLDEIGISFPVLP